MYGMRKGEGMARVQETKRELTELFQLFHRERLTTETPPDGITPNEARTLMLIGMYAANGESVRPGQIAERMRTTPSAISQTLKALEEKDLIERHRASGDFRTITLELTERGHAVTESARALRDQHMDDVLAYLGPEDAEHLVRILKKIIAFHEQSGCGTMPDSSGENNHEGGAPCA